MAIQVMQPQKKPSGLSDILQVGGAIAGGMLAGPGGAAALSGAMTGAAAGGIVGGVLDKTKQQAQQAPVNDQSEAIRRRMMNMQEQRASNLQALMAAEDATKALSVQQQQQYLPALTRARLAASRDMGVV